MTTLKINYTNHTIEMPSRKYATAASKFGSQQYYELREACRDFPTYQVVTRVAPTRYCPLRGLSYEAMEAYIANHDENGEIKKEFDFLRGKSDNYVCPAPYFTIKKWFLETYKDFEDHYEYTTNENTMSTII